MHWEIRKFLWFTLLWYSLYCSGLEPDLQYLKYACICLILKLKTDYEIINIAGHLRVWRMGLDLSSNPDSTKFQLCDLGQVIETSIQLPGGPMVKNLPPIAKDTGSIPGPEKLHMAWGN